MLSFPNHKREPTSLFLFIPRSPFEVSYNTFVFLQALMESHLRSVVALLSLAVVAVSHAALSSEVYWDTVLPNTPMPKAVREMLRTDLDEEKSASVNVGKGGVVVNPGKPNMFNYQYAATEDQLHEDPNVALFFLEKDLHRGSKMNLHFTRSTERATFLPRQLADAIPFTSDKLADVMKKFSVEPQSLEAEQMKQTIKQCEEPAQEGEEKYCATSLESMVDFTVSKLGKHVLPISTEVDKEETVRQQYTIGAGVKKMGGKNSIACHSQTYAYAVFYCHETHTTKAYKVPLVGADGTKATAVVVCHTDTSKWNPKHLAFQVLKVKPGTVPVCHFLPEDHIVWTSN